MLLVDLDIWCFGLMVSFGYIYDVPIVLFSVTDIFLAIHIHMYNSDIHNNNVMRKMFLLIQNSNLTLLFYLFGNSFIIFFSTYRTSFFTNGIFNDSKFLPLLIYFIPFCLLQINISLFKNILYKKYWQFIKIFFI